MTALITMDPSTVGAWAEHERLSATRPTPTWPARRRSHELSPRRCTGPTRTCPRASRSGGSSSLHKQFDPDDDEITRTRKVRRCGDQLALRRHHRRARPGRPSVEVHSIVTYQDGTQRGAQRSICGSSTDRLTSSLTARAAVPSGVDADEHLLVHCRSTAWPTAPILALAALGFVLIYKATSVINFAQGEFLLVGAYTFYAAFVLLGLPIAGQHRRGPGRGGPRHRRRALRPAAAHRRERHQRDHGDDRPVRGPAGRRPDVLRHRGP